MKTGVRTEQITGFDRLVCMFVKLVGQDGPYGPIHMKHSTTLIPQYTSFQRNMIFLDPKFNELLIMATSKVWSFYTFKLVLWNKCSFSKYFGRFNKYLWINWICMHKQKIMDTIVKIGISVSVHRFTPSVIMVA